MFGEALEQVQSALEEVQELRTKLDARRRQGLGAGGVGGGAGSSDVSFQWRL